MMAECIASTCHGDAAPMLNNNNKHLRWDVKACVKLGWLKLGC